MFFAQIGWARNPAWIALCPGRALAAFTTFTNLGDEMEGEEQSQQESSEEWQSGEEPEADEGEQTGKQKEAGESADNGK
jgi:hypothetical protein